ncbi:hypothetical protein SELMODRAFT_432268 [Selaginella moellendorffii]|uniref:Ribosomal protein S8 n=1 Tax=Selaginella moellendorffii TaxID=88036 RepID=D8TFH4_SELML|nr:40S ribosomal protein S15a [Selaginella moellendorffii]XP_024527238.1 40S ribosomal protein S15a [Selaginella moellendorffii]XP_024543009.1 40S ribosomal protein S15a [Selaginella moellendorffii]EFJ04586.1 hypothetical protein SELMODRAFT_432268 [Selaginella moellendorffii]|eukprot:XP_002994343.1 40S ribosomal protein S15a [Selaginella moellendorffii]
MVRLSSLNDAARLGRKNAVIRPSSNLVLRFLEVMKKQGFVENFQRHGGHTPGHITVEITDKLKKCVLLSQRFDTKSRRIDAWARQILPAPEVGHLVITNFLGVMDHREAKKKNLGGRILGYFY